MALTSASVRLSRNFDAADFYEPVVSSSVTISASAIVVNDGVTGHAKQASDTASERFLGIAQETVDGDGSKTMKVYSGVEYKFTSLATLLAASGSKTVGMNAFAKDDDTVGTKTDVSNDNYLGTITENDGTTCWVLVGHYAAEDAGE